MKAAWLFGIALSFGAFGVASGAEAMPATDSHTVERTGTFFGARTAYRVRAESVRLGNNAGTPLADIFSVSYIVEAPKANPRPVIFFFPGGPGSAASGLDLGGFGPRVMDYPMRPVRAKDAPLKENRSSLVAVADLVFVDMPGVGYSRIIGAGREVDVYGVRQDAQLQARFVKAWLARHGEESAPIVLAGKSYGALRAAYTALELTASATGPNIVGLILLSGAWDVTEMDFPGAFTPGGHQSAYWAFLPAYAAIAWQLGRVPHGGTFEAFIQDAREFAHRLYAPALLAGQKLSEQERRVLAGQLSRFIGLSPEFILQHENRISSTVFRQHLVPGRTLGFDNALFAEAEEPHEFGGDLALDAAWKGYLADLGFPNPAGYVTGSIRPAARWDWIAAEEWRMGYPRVTDALRPVLQRRRKLDVFVAVGFFDLAVSFFTAETGASAPGIAEERITFRRYLSGHSIWIYPPARDSLSRDLQAFVTRASDASVMGRSGSASATLRPN